MQGFNSLMEAQQHEIMKNSLKLIDRKNFLLNVLQTKNLLKLSREILQVNHLAQMMHKKE